jgi:hypothetical protein
MSFVKSLGCEVVNRTRRIPFTSPTAASNSAKLILPPVAEDVGSRYEFTFCPSSWISVYPASAILRASAITEAEARERSFPRVYGTTQYAQNLSHPSTIVMYPRCGFPREVNSVSNVSSVCRSSSPVIRVSPASSRTSISGRFR